MADIGSPKPILRRTGSMQPGVAALQEGLARTKDLAYQEHLQDVWNKGKPTPVPFRRYAEVVVLMITWERTDLNQKLYNEETRELSELFKTKFGFRTVPLKLTSSPKTSQWLVAGLSQFMAANDHENTLLIIYYAGHGCGYANKETGEPEFMCYERSNSTLIEGISWTAAEIHLLDAVYADILAIFDCCESGSLCETRGPRSYEYLAACSADGFTGIAGEHSFTRALIWALEEMIKDGKKSWFSVFELKEMIRHAPKLPRLQYPQHGKRKNALVPYNDIIISPSDKCVSRSALEQRQQAEVFVPVTCDSLDIRLHFSTDLTDQVLEDISRFLQTTIPDQTPAKKVTFVKGHGKRSGISLWHYAIEQVLGKSGNSKKQMSDKAQLTPPNTQSQATSMALQPPSTDDLPVTPAPSNGGEGIDEAHQFEAEDRYTQLNVSPSADTGLHCTNEQRKRPIDLEGLTEGAVKRPRDE